MRDHDDSNAWTDWSNAADLPNKIRPTTLIVPDPNVRVQAVINGQGIALMDQMIAEEIDTGTLFALSDIQLTDYGYFVARPRRAEDPEAVDDFVEWLSSLL